MSEEIKTVKLLDGEGNQVYPEINPESAGGISYDLEFTGDCVWSGQVFIDSITLKKGSHAKTLEKLMNAQSISCKFFGVDSAASFPIFTQSDSICVSIADGDDYPADTLCIYFRILMPYGTAEYTLITIYLNSDGSIDWEIK